MGRETSTSLEETNELASNFVQQLSVGASATVIGLSGELGSGKTTFVKGVAKALGVEQVVTSPTFVIEKIYKLTGQAFLHLIHIDAYRLESGRELAALGFAGVANESGNLILIEWPERVSDVLSSDIKTIQFEALDERTRSIEFPNNL